MVHWLPVKRKQQKSCWGGTGVRVSGVTSLTETVSSFEVVRNRLPGRESSDPTPCLTPWITDPAFDLSCFMKLDTTWDLANPVEMSPLPGLGTTDNSPVNAPSTHNSNEPQSIFPEFSLYLTSTHQASISPALFPQGGGALEPISP